MKLSERGSSLIQVLLVILVVTVLGLALMGNVLGENKRTYKTETNMQARYLAESGLTYFEKDFNHFVQNIDFDTVVYTNPTDFIHTYFLNKLKNGSQKYLTGVKVSSTPEETITVTAKVLENETNGLQNASNKITLKVTSSADKGSSNTKLYGYYDISFTTATDFDTPTYQIADFSMGGRFSDVTKTDLIGLDLLKLLNLDVVNPAGTDTFYYPIPSDKSFLGVDLLFGAIGIHLDGNKPFQTMENNPVISARQGVVANVNLLSLVKVNVLEYRAKNDTNMVIDGSFSTGIKILIINLTSNYYKDIHFKKLAVIGNAVIQQDKIGEKYERLLMDDLYTYDHGSVRTFTFDNGLYVNKSLFIGKNKPVKDHYKGISNLVLTGKMVAMEDLEISYVNLNYGKSTTDDAIYVHRDAHIHNACINKESTNTNKFRLLAKGNITLENNTSCSEFKGLFYSEKDIVIKTNNQPMIIKGGLIGNVKVDYPDKLTYISDPRYIGDIKTKLKDIKLDIKGRDFKER